MRPTAVYSVYGWLDSVHHGYVEYPACQGGKSAVLQVLSRIKAGPGFPDALWTLLTIPGSNSNTKLIVI